MRPLIHIGYHKTATTWLQSRLFNQEWLGFRSPYDGETLCAQLCAPHALDFNPEACQRHFASRILSTEDAGLVAILSAERLSGNPHSGGHDSKEMATRLASTFPQARILIVIREQRRMILSIYKQFVRAGGVTPFDRYLRGVEDLRIPRFDRRHLLYDRLIDCYRRLFGSDAVLVLPYELFVDCGATFVERIRAFVGFPQVADGALDLPFSARVNPSLSGLSTTIKRQLNRVIGNGNSLNSSSLLVAPALERTLLNGIGRLDLTLGLARMRRFDAQMRVKIAASVAGYYRESNARTELLAGERLGGYGYDLEPAGDDR